MTGCDSSGTGGRVYVGNNGLHSIGIGGGFHRNTQQIGISILMVDVLVCFEGLRIAIVSFLKTAPGWGSVLRWQQGETFSATGLIAAHHQHDNFWLEI